MDGCHLSYLPEEIGNLISLQTLTLAKNNLNTLPDGICNLTCLKRLNLAKNNVSNLPSGIGRLTSLEGLNLSRNNLWTLPDTIGKLSCLKYLWVGNNKLSHLPSEIGDLDSLKTLGLSELENAVEIFVPAGEEELRIWFPYHDGRGPNVSFVAPSPSVNQKMLGWILRLVLCAPRESSYGYAGVQLEGGDEVEFEMCQKALPGIVEIPMSQDVSGVVISLDVTHLNTLVKKWAIDLIYEADEIHKGNDTWCQVLYNIQL
ncbi:hypothetical protein C3L33_23481, partial [Rhododendron williamsianum]